jgi:hypothetical protein
MGAPSRLPKSGRWRIWRTCCGMISTGKFTERAMKHCSWAVACRASAASRWVSSASQTSGARVAEVTEPPSGPKVSTQSARQEAPVTTIFAAVAACR